MCPTIRVDDEVYAALQAGAVPFQDTPNSVMRRVLGLRDADARSQPNEAVRTAAEKGRRPRGRTSGRKRAPKGSILPESEYEIPLLQALADLGGSAAASRVIEAIAPKLHGKLTNLDLQPLPSGRLRWHNRVQFTRLNLVRGGDLVGDSVRGIWVLSSQGRARLDEARKARST